jgi:hypothetical protein
MRGKTWKAILLVMGMVGMSGLAAAEADDDTLGQIAVRQVESVIPKDCKGIQHHVAFRDGPLSTIPTGLGYSVPVDDWHLAVGVFQDFGWVKLEDGLDYYEYEFSGSTKYDDAKDKCW